ncbi:MAG: carbohydrate ABC transporter permease [Chloroflexi bacterium]|nr:carbohydrate ABC transporter permease [Chloroflexota bacterium]
MATNARDSNWSESGPGSPVVDSVRVDQVTPRARAGVTARIVISILLTIVMLIPVVWMAMTAIKSRPDATASPPKVFFKPSWDGFIGLFADRSQLSFGKLKEYQERTDLNFWEQQALIRGMRILGPSKFVGRLRNSLIIAVSSTLLSVALGVLSAYAFSRYDIKGKGDLLFFILSTRMLPPVVVTIPIFLMYRAVGLYDTHIGMILLYTAFNLSFSVWLLKGFIDEIPKEYEEAALVDGYSRLQAFRKVVLPQAATGIVATAVFCLIFAWNEYAFALMLTGDKARTAPPSIPSMLGVGGIEWGSIAAGSLLFLIPVVIVTFALRNHLLRGVTFGAIRQ